MKAEKIKVLYVDDEANNLVSFNANFRKHFEIFTASSALQGMEILSKEEIHVIISDQRMPGKTGVAFLESVSEKYPEPIKMLLTGYDEMEVKEAVSKAHIYKCLNKPWNNRELVASIKEGYEQYCRNRKK